MRRVVIWLLVILSPLAFVAYILPATRSFSRMWWNQFVQWTIIGVFAAFFLWLGDQMIGLAAQGGLTGDVPSSGPGGLGVAGIFNDVAPYGVALIFLLLGFFVALSTSAMGAGGIIAGGQAFGRQAGAWAGKQTRERAAGWARGRALKSPTVQRIGERLAMSAKPPTIGGIVGGLPIVGPGVKRVGEAVGKSKRVGAVARGARRAGEAVGKVPYVGAVARGVGGAARGTLRGTPVLAPAWTAARELGRTVTTRAQGVELRNISGAQERAKKNWKIAESKYEGLQVAATPAERIGILQAAREEGQIKDLEKIARDRGREEEFRETIMKAGKEALSIHPDAFKQIRVSFPNLAEEIGQGFSQAVRDRAKISPEEAHREGYATVVRKIIGEMTTDEATRIAPSASRNADVITAMHEFWDGPKVAAAARTIGKGFVDSFNEEMRRRGGGWYERHNPKIMRYVSRTTSQELGFRPPPLTGTEDVPGPPPVPPPPHPPGEPPSEGPPPPRGRPGLGIGPTRPPRGRPGIGV